MFLGSDSFFYMNENLSKYLSSQPRLIIPRTKKESAIYEQ